MMFVTKKAVARRTVLRAMGTAVALPFLDAMAPALSAQPKSTPRLGFIYVANGTIQDQWRPATAGPNLELSPILKLLAPVKSRVGNGTRFRIALPPMLMREAPMPRTVTGAPMMARLDGWLLAMLDDEDAPRLALRAALESVGATVVEAESLGRLKRLLDAQERFPDVLIFDLDLGAEQPDGRIALAELRQDWETQVPAVILTGRVGARSVILPPLCTILEKPVALIDLVATLNRMAPRTDLAL